MGNSNFQNKPRVLKGLEHFFIANLCPKATNTPGHHPKYMEAGKPFLHKTISNLKHSAPRFFLHVLSIYLYCTQVCNGVVDCPGQCGDILDCPPEGEDEDGCPDQGEPS